MAGLLDRLFNLIGTIFPKTRWVPDDGSFILSSDDVQRRRMVMVSLCAVVMAGCYTALQIMQLNAPGAVWFDLLSCVVICAVSVATMLAAIWGQKPEPYMRLLLMGFSALLWAEIAFSGGVNGYHVGILPILPVVAAIILTTRDTIMLTFLNLVVVLAIAYMGMTGKFLPEFSISPQNDILMSSFIIVISILGCSGAAIMLIQQSEKVNRQLLALVEYQSHLAAHDHLTGLGNRISLQKRFEDLQQGEAFDILLIDLDGFKAVNDTHGHNAGDYLIKAMACRLREVTNEQDLLVRLGGDEFVILLEDVDGTLSSVRKYAEYLIDIISRPYLWDNGVVLRVSASIGHARYPNHGSNPGKVLSLADKALYKAKDAGKSQCVTFGTEACPKSNRKAAIRPQSADSKRKIAAFTPNLRQKSK